MKASIRATLAASIILCAATGCASTARPAASRDPVLDESSLFEPPSDWAAAVAFAFADSAVLPTARFHTRVEFDDGLRHRTVTVADNLPELLGGPRTPWYRLRPGRDTTVISIRFTLEHESGARTVAVYPLRVSKDEFFDVYAGVYTREEPRAGSPPPSPSSRGYPLAPSAAAAPGDSLWVWYHLRGRSCFHCPF